MSVQVKDEMLPEIPNKRYFTISEVSHLCKVKAHVLRYWEQEFKELSPNKRRGNRRYYQPNDVLLIRKIRRLLYEHGFTIDGARQKIVEDFKQHDSFTIDSLQDGIGIANVINELELILSDLKA